MEVIRLTEPKKKPWLSETIDFDRDIEPYQFIAIYAGVGSGKNVFVDNLVLGNIFTHADGSPVSPKNILLISSRRAKIDEQLKLDNVVYDPAILNDVFASNPFLFSDPKYDNYWESPTITISSPEDWGSGVPAYARSCAFTNAKTEWYIAGHYILSAPTSHLWERFDMIIIDEAHSLFIKYIVARVSDWKKEKEREKHDIRVAINGTYKANAIWDMVDELTEEQLSCVKRLVKRKNRPIKVRKDIESDNWWKYNNTDIIRKEGKDWRGPYTLYSLGKSFYNPLSTLYQANGTIMRKDT